MFLNKAVLMAVLGASIVASAAGTGDIGSGGLKSVVQCSSPSVDVDVKISGNQLVIEVAGLDGTTITNTRDLDNGEKIDLKNFSSVAISKRVENHGVLGYGIFFSINNRSASLVHNGLVHSLDCN